MLDHPEAPSMSPCCALDATLPLAANQNGDMLASSSVSTACPPSSAGTSPVSAASSSEPVTHETAVTHQALLLYALTSLYEDQIHPFFCDIERRLQELQAPPVVEKHFVALYSLMPAVYEVTPAPHDNTAATRDSPSSGVRPFPSPSPSTRVYLRSQHIPCGFRGWVDPKSSVNPYPERVWRQLSDYLCVLMREGGCGRGGEATGEFAYQFKGGRYGMAMELKKRSLHWTNEWTLGEMCHIVQLAITKGLLAYENNILQPVAACKGIASAVLEVTPRTQAQPPSPTTPTSPGFPPNTTTTTTTTTATSDGLADECDGRGGKGGGAACLKDVELVKECISSLLKDFPQGILLSQFKRRFSAKFRRTIVPTAFGHIKLSSFLTHPPMDEVCRVYKSRDNKVTIHPTNYVPLPGMEPLTPLTARANAVTVDVPDDAFFPPDVPQDIRNITYNHWTARNAPPPASHPTTHPAPLTLELPRSSSAAAAPCRNLTIIIPGQTTPTPHTHPHTGTPHPFVQYGDRVASWDVDDGPLLPTPSRGQVWHGVPVREGGGSPKTPSTATSSGDEGAGVGSWDGLGSPFLPYKKGAGGGLYRAAVW
ncbi:unnamed protein product [Vitrella brassicaformis CCMP3155]|uniref:HTH OST-type domain-containing protein n=1 Tax=Vitrella brassicaformis (strain CCMP3155) TaxID=1169540 RepID=A0A0G4ELI3_VITBC|nr:unnamed protein product [Vitrella brassicaformis CCMP3155]|eukprot:CEL97678.1 unnamed protein product [Vitrella brassicaformis CCMP3155]